MKKVLLNSANVHAWAFVVCAFLLLTGCNTFKAADEPVKAAETSEQKAFAAYGTFVVFEEQGAALIEDPRVVIEAKRVIQSADAAAKPVADATLTLALELKEARRLFSEGTTSEERIIIVTDNLNSWLLKLEPLVKNLVNAVQEATQ